MQHCFLITDIADRLSDGIAMVDSRFEIVRYNESFSTLLQIRPSASTNIASCFPSECCELVTHWLMEAFNKRAPMDGDLYLSSRAQWIRISFLPCAGQMCVVLQAPVLSGIAHTDGTETTHLLERILFTHSHIVRKPLATMLGLIEVINYPISRQERLFCIKQLKALGDELDHAIRLVTIDVTKHLK